jgi:hypothetical protein
MWGREHNYKKNTCFSAVIYDRLTEPNTKVFEEEIAPYCFALSRMKMETRKRDVIFLNNVSV